MIYEYQCEHCNNIIEYITNDYDLQIVECDKCKGDAHRIMSTGYLKLPYELTMEDIMRPSQQGKE